NPLSAARSERSSLSKNVFVSSTAPTRCAPISFSRARTASKFGTLSFASISMAITYWSTKDTKDTKEDTENHRFHRLHRCSIAECRLPIAEWLPPFGNWHSPIRICVICAICGSTLSYFVSFVSFVDNLLSDDQ